MTIATKKKKMKDFRDFYNGDIISLEDVDKAKTNKDLLLCCQRHFRYLEDQHTDALTHMDNFIKYLGLS
jgi:hypothetical protein